MVKLILQNRREDQWRKTCTNEVRSHVTRNFVRLSWIPVVRWQDYHQIEQHLTLKCHSQKRKPWRIEINRDVRINFMYILEASNWKFFSNVAIAKYGGLTAGCNTWGLTRLVALSGLGVLVAVLVRSAWKSLSQLCLDAYYSALCWKTQV